MIEPIRGKVYVVKHSSGMIEARFIGLRVYNPTFDPNRLHNLRSTTHYIFQNLKTGRDVVLKSRVKIKREAV